MTDAPEANASFLVPVSGMCVISITACCEAARYTRDYWAEKYPG